MLNVILCVGFEVESKLGVSRTLFVQNKVPVIWYL